MYCDLPLGFFLIFTCLLIITFVSYGIYKTGYILINLLYFISTIFFICILYNLIDRLCYNYIIGWILTGAFSTVISLWTNYYYTNILPL
jgi:hypothetical protein